MSWNVSSALTYLWPLIPQNSGSKKICENPTPEAQPLKKNYPVLLKGSETANLAATLYCPKQEKGRPKILVHGYLADSRALAFLARKWHNLGYPVINIDHFGHGKSDIPSLEHFNYTSPFDYAEGLSAVLKSEGLAQADLVCHSMGARICLAFAARHPEQVSSMILMTPWMWTVFLSDLVAGKSNLVKNFIGSFWAMLNSISMLTGVGNQIPIRMEPEIRKMARDSTEKWNAALKKSPHSTPVDIRYLTSQIHSAELLAEIAAKRSALAKIPTMVFNGGSDLLTPTEQGAFVAAIFGTSLNVFLGAGHEIVYERAAEIVAISEAFFAGRKLSAEELKKLRILQAPAAVIQDLVRQAQLPPPDRDVVGPLSKHHISLRMIRRAVAAALEKGKDKLRSE